MKCPSEEELIDAIADAARQAIGALFRDHPGDFYYCTLVTTGEAHPPTLAAWSHQSLEAAVAEASEPDALESIKWSYADSPFLCFGDEYFSAVKQLFAQRPEMDYMAPEDEWDQEYELRLRAIEAAMARLDAEGLFGSGEQRNGIVVLVEVMPPDGSNTLRAIRLNPERALKAWLNEAAEPVE